MLEKDKWTEIFQALMQNKRRTFLTIFGIFWGMLMLMLMIGAGKGLENGVKASGIGAYATNSCFMFPQKTTVAHKGFPEGREYLFNLADLLCIKERMKGNIDLMVPVFNIQRNISYQDIQTRTELYGHTPDIMKIEPKKIIEGRFINERDLSQGRKVAVIGKFLKNTLFPPGEHVVGKYISMEGSFYKVIGVQTNLDADRQGKQHNETVTIPYTTMQREFRLGNKVGGIAFTAKDGQRMNGLIPQVLLVLKSRHLLAANDSHAIGYVNIEETFLEITRLFEGINKLTWFVGILTLVAGAIGISNIMLITVKERTKEIGIRRALGATPAMIISQIMTESVLMITAAGYAGLLSGVLIVRLLKASIANAEEMEGFLNPEVNIGVSFLCLLLLTILGVLAGVIPALSALKISPVMALRD